MRLRVRVFPIARFYVSVGRTLKLPKGFVSLYKCDQKNGIKPIPVLVSRDDPLAPGRGCDHGIVLWGGRGYHLPLLVKTLQSMGLKAVIVGL